MIKIFAITFCIFSILLSCRGVRMISSKTDGAERPYMLAIFMDGTGDKPHGTFRRNTNVKKVHSLTFENIRTVYIEGVGAGNRLKHSKYAITTRERVMEAYRFLSNNYRSSRDSICLFGFSRGANQCRILASIIYTIGIIDLKQIENECDKSKLLLDLYDLYVTTATPFKRKQLATFINNWESDHPGSKLKYDTTGTTMIELMGLWDTVEALVYNDHLETTTPVPQHLNQISNIKKLYHAVSLDDNRAFNYTPILATHQEVELQPGQDINLIVDEVWFNGSHKDVGGGVRNGNKDHLSGMSLNWMLARVEPYHLFKPYSATTDTFGKVNDMRGNPVVLRTSPCDTLRGINKYWNAMNPAWNEHKIKVHRSVIARLESGVIQDFKTKNDRKDWYDWYPFSNCFKKEGDKIIFNSKDCKCIEVVN
jgi:hypothetical protein